MNKNLFRKYDITGQKFNRLTAISFEGKIDGRRYFYKFLCECGNEIILKSTVVRNGATKSCGCLQKEKTSELRKKSALSAEQAFARAKIDKTNGCWQWLGCKDKDGYGVLGFSAKYEKAHRLSYMLKYGDIPDGIFVCHHCDNPSCVNPDHLFLGTPKDNVQDMINKGRQKPGGRPSPGEKNGRALITEDQAKTILSLAGSVSQDDLAKEFGICRSQVQKIINGKAWSFLQRENKKGQRSNMKKIMLLDSNHEVIKIFAGTKEAALYIGSKQQAVWAACTKQHKLKGNILKFENQLLTKKTRKSYPPRDSHGKFIKK